MLNAIVLLLTRSILQSANYVRTELPVRIAHRLRDLQTLPYVVVTQEGIAKVYEVRPPPIIHASPHHVLQLYWSAFEKYWSVLHLLQLILIVKRIRFRKYPPITNLAENEAFCKFLTELLDEQYVSHIFADHKTTHLFTQVLL